MNALRKTILATTLLTVFPLVHAAEEKSPIDFSATLTFTSDYVFRGYTQTDDGPAIQGSFDLSHESGAYAGIWGSNVKFLEGNDVAPEDRAHLEIDYYAGYSGDLESGATYGLEWLYFTYPGTNSDFNYDAHEFKLNLGYAAQSAELGFNYAYSPDDFGGVGKGHNYELTLGYALPTGLGFGAKVGRKSWKEDDAGDDYTYYGASISYSVADFDVSVNYSDTDLDNVDSADGRVYLEVSRSF